MKQKLKNLVKKIIRAQGYEVSKIQPDIFSDLRFRDFSNCLEVLKAINYPNSDEYVKFFSFVKENKNRSFAQNFQDLFVLYCMEEVPGEQFVEFGAADGLINSNTYLLEQSYNWTGVLAEPNTGYVNTLRTNRKCRIDNRAVFSANDKNIEFMQKEDLQLSGITATIDNQDKQRSTYTVKTVTLDTLLSDHHIQRQFGFLSIDVEGAELEVLKGFDLNYWKPRSVVIEHNFHPVNSREIQDYFVRQGYIQKFPALSKCDYWFTIE